MFFGLVRRSKPYIHAHWYVSLAGFRSDPEAFYTSIEEELEAQEVPDMTPERIVLKQGSLLSSGRKCLRLRRERFVIDICSAPFGKGWWFSVRAATLGRSLKGWEVLLALLGLAGFAIPRMAAFRPADGGHSFRRVHPFSPSGILRGQRLVKPRRVSGVSSRSRGLL